MFFNYSPRFIVREILNQVYHIQCWHLYRKSNLSFSLKVYAQVVIDYDFFQSLNGLEFEFGIYLLPLSLLCIIKYVLWFAALLLTSVWCFYSCNLTNWVLWCLHWDHSGKHGWHHAIQSKYSTFCFMWNCYTLRCVSWFVVCHRIQGRISPYKFLVPCLSVRVKFTNQ